VTIDGFGGDARRGFFGVFDGHQGHIVADFVAASLHQVHAVIIPAHHTTTHPTRPHTRLIECFFRSIRSSRCAY
jgi:serine/threonine protein phosphatase PrpC